MIATLHRAASLARRIGSAGKRALIGAFAGLVVVALAVELAGRFGLVHFSDNDVGSHAYRRVLGLGSAAFATLAALAGAKNLPTTVGATLMGSALGTGMGVLIGVMIGGFGGKAGWHMGWLMGATMGMFLGGWLGFTMALSPQEGLATAAEAPPAPDRPEGTAA